MIATWIGTAALGMALAAPASHSALRLDETGLKLADCPSAVRKTLELETKGAKIDTVNKLTEDGATKFATSVELGGKTYHLQVDEKGLLEQMAIDVGETEVKFSACPAAVQSTLRSESHQAKFDVVNRDLRSGVTVYEAVAEFGGKEYSYVVAQNGTLIEKVLVIAEDDIELSHCPSAVQNAIKEHARGGKIGLITRSTGVGGHFYEVELEIGGKGYLVEFTEGGGLISKALLEDEDQDEDQGN